MEEGKLKTTKYINVVKIEVGGEERVYPISPSPVGLKSRSGNPADGRKDTPRGNNGVTKVLSAQSAYNPWCNLKSISKCDLGAFCLLFDKVSRERHGVGS